MKRLPILCLAGALGFLNAGIFAQAQQPTSNAASNPAARLAAAADLSAKDLKTLRLIDVIDCARTLADTLEAGASDPQPDHLVAASNELDAITQHLRQMDQTLQTDDSHWKWTTAGQAPMEEARDQEKFVIDPPLEGGSAIAFQVNSRRVHLQSIKVIDKHGIPTEFPIDQTFSSSMKKKEVRYLYYPTGVSTIIISYASEKDARGYVGVWAGTTDLPEYGKEALYWFALARNDLADMQVSSAVGHIKLGIMNTYLFRLSRRVQ